MTLNSKRVLVTGASGMTGSAVIRELLSRYSNIKIRGTWLNSKPLIKDARVEYINADLTRSEDCYRVADGCDYAVMAAANTGGALSSQTSPERQLSDNLVMDIRLLNAFESANVKRAVFLSSATVYPPLDHPAKEDDLDWNIDPHPAHFGVGWAKRSAEKLCAFWHTRSDREFIIARCSNIFGPFDRFDAHHSNFIPALIRKAVDRLDPFEVWGAPDVIRDVIYVEDVADAVIAMLTNQDIGFDTFNLGSGPVSVDEVVHTTLNSADHHPKAVQYQPSAPGGIRYRALDCGKIAEKLGWQPEYDVKSAIASTTRWWLENRNEWKR